MTPWEHRLIDADAERVLIQQAYFPLSLARPCPTCRAGIGGVCTSEHVSEAVRAVWAFPHSARIHLSEISTANAVREKWGL